MKFIKTQVPKGGPSGASLLSEAAKYDFTIYKFLQFTILKELVKNISNLL